MLISFILYPVCDWMEKKRINKANAILIAVFDLFLFFGAVVYLLFTQIMVFSNEWYIVMILFIPFISIVKLIADRTKNLKTLSVLFGDFNQEESGN